VWVLLGHLAAREAEEVSAASRTKACAVIKRGGGRGTRPPLLIALTFRSAGARTFPDYIRPRYRMRGTERKRRDGP
jgi:hypothetical protein